MGRACLLTLSSHPALKVQGPCHKFTTQHGRHMPMANSTQIRPPKTLNG
ncbi:uncharacterized protein G2W53_023381 [Senna tora]|uniref:Uncharacterized protein n=1 Tax=Senna tora TaxID=362788 RepID=A0A834WFZ3_9FABA|nr:uncharacterized protein G2W53_023381 [Senna tora]